MMAYSLPCLVIDAACCLRSQLEMLNETPICGVFMWLLLLYRMVAEFQGQKRKLQRKLINPLGPSLGNPQHYFYYSLFVQLVTSPTPGEGEKNPLSLLMGCGKFLEDHVGLEILVWAFLENTFCCG